MLWPLKQGTTWLYKGTSGWERSHWALLVASNDRFYKLEGDRADTVRKRFADPGDNLAGLVQEQELMLQLPLFPGKLFGETLRNQHSSGGSVTMKRFCRRTLFFL